MREDLRHEAPQTGQEFRTELGKTARTLQVSARLKEYARALQPPDLLANWGREYVNHEEPHPFLEELEKHALFQKDAETAESLSGDPYLNQEQFEWATSTLHEISD